MNTAQYAMLWLAFNVLALPYVNSSLKRWLHVQAAWIWLTAVGIVLLYGPIVWNRAGG